MHQTLLNFNPRFAQISKFPLKLNIFLLKLQVTLNYVICEARRQGHIMDFMFTVCVTMQAADTNGRRANGTRLQYCSVCLVSEELHQ